MRCQQEEKMRLISLPNIKDDELLYSYLKRVADANVIEYKELLEISSTRGYELYGYVYPFFSAMELDESEIINLLEKTDLLFLLAPFTDNYSFISEMVLRVQNRQRHVELLKPPKAIKRRYGIKKLKICPSCVKNNMYLQRQHQMPGVNICHRHHTFLWEHIGKTGTEFDIKEYRPISDNSISEADIAYADYVYDLTTRIRTDADLDSIKSLLAAKLDELKEKMVMQIESKGLIQDKGPMGVFPEQGEEHFIKGSRSMMKNSKLVDIFKLLMMFYKNIGDLNMALDKYIPVRSFLKEYRQVYERGLLSLYKHDCGNVFISSPRLLAEGWTCPYCDDTASPNQFFQKLTASNEDFELIGDAPVISKAYVQVKHKCGHILRVRADDLLQSRTRCDYRITGYASKKIPEGIVPFSYAGLQENNTYSQNPFQNLSNLTCPYCRKETKIQGQIRKIESDIPGFKVLDCVCWSKPVKLRHMACKKSFTVSNIGDFKKNPRCPTCWKVPKMIPKAKDTADKKPSRLAYTDPDLAAEWDYERNALTPIDYTRSSQKKVRWICSKGHSWSAMIAQRVYQKTGCPYCLEKKRRL